MITHAQLSTMLALQESLNAKVNPNWKLAGYAWHRAIMVEAVELLEHVGWKWWKAQEPNIAQARLELVDIWHFAMSLAMVLTTLPNGKQVSYPHNGDLYDRCCMANAAHEDALADRSVKEVRWIIARSRE